MRVGRYQAIAVWLALGLMLLGGGSTARSTGSDEALNDKCIRCHMEIFRQGQESACKHRPCFERQCISCHLAPESRPNGQEAAAATVTGMPVAQQGNQWRKTDYFTGEGKATKHEITLLGLAATKAYRFRIVVSDRAKPGSGHQQASQWLGVVPGEVWGSASSADQPLLISGSAAELILSPAIEGLGKEVVVRWQSPAESYGWVELQSIEGINLELLAASPAADKTGGQAAKAPEAEPHPLLVSQEYAAIDLCYTCHPENGLGTSHPVRVYGREKEIRIPDSLPTGKDGMLTCVTCHDPHGGKGKALVRELIVTKLCVTCHYTFNRTSPSTMF